MYKYKISSKKSILKKGLYENVETIRALEDYGQGGLGGGGGDP